MDQFQIDYPIRISRMGGVPKLLILGKNVQFSNRLSHKDFRIGGPKNYSVYPKMVSFKTIIP